MSASIPTLEVHIRFRTVQIFFALTVFASLTVATCNTMVVGHGDISNWPGWSINLAYWAGSISLAMAGAGMFFVTYLALRPAGRRWALPPALLFGLFLSLGAVGHGSFFPLYQTHQLMVGFPEGSEIRTVIEELRGQMRWHMIVLFLTPVAVLLVGSVWFSITVWFRPTLYPRWMAAVNLFVIALITFTLGEQTFLPTPIKVLFQGLGFHGGLLLYYLLTYRTLIRHNLSADPAERAVTGSRDHRHPTAAQR